MLLRIKDYISQPPLHVTRLASHFPGTILKRQLVCAVVPLLPSSFHHPAAWDIGTAILGHEEGDHPLGILEQ